MTLAARTMKRETEPRFTSSNGGKPTESGFAARLEA
jgi:hypothetical protein